MKFSLRRSLGLVCCLFLTTGLAACSESDDDGKKKVTEESFEVPQGYDKTCRPLSETQTIDYKKTGKKEVSEYLAGICELPVYYTQDEFQNRPEDKQVIGESCFCYGNNCNYLGFERPEVETIFGCDGVPKTFKGAQRSCFRSSKVKAIKPEIFFPLGTCALAMSKCHVDIPENDIKNADGSIDEVKTAEQRKNASLTICGFSTFGDPAEGKGADNKAYDKHLAEFTECPNGEVLVDFVMPISAVGKYANVDIRACFQGCRQDSDCHGAGIYDPKISEQSNTKCVMAKAEDGTQAGVCFDLNSVKTTESKGIKLVNPGKFAAEAK